MNTSEKSQEVKTERQKLKVQSRKRAMDNVKQGKNPYFAKKSDLRRSELKNKFEKLKKEGKVDKYLAKRRKQNLQKDKKTL
jgi:ribosomal RNA-processing protein 36